jgi:hypothetical protein
MEKAQEHVPQELALSSLAGIDNGPLSNRTKLIRGALPCAAGVALIGFVFVMLFTRIGVVMRAHADVAAMNSLQKISLAEFQYQAAYPALGFSCSLAAFGGDPASGPPTPEAAQMVHHDLAAGRSNGYDFKIAGCKKDAPGLPNKVTGYQIVAVPVKIGGDSTRGFCTDESGLIMVDPHGGSNCTEPLH